MMKTYFLLDRSGSMSDKWTETIGSINAYVEELAKTSVVGDVTLSVFDSDVGFQYQVVRRDVVVSDWKGVDDSEVSPRGSTPLYDAVARLFADVNADAPDKAVIVIVTDGHENSSRKVEKDGAKKMVEDAKRRGWQVLFMGAEFDNYDQSASLGGSYDQTISTSRGSRGLVMRETALMASGYASTGATMAYSVATRAVASGGSK